MIITNINSGAKVRETGKKKNVGKSSQASAFSDIMGAASENSDVEQAPAAVNIGPVLSMDSLGFLSNINNEEFVKKQNIDWGKDVLTELNSIKYQILNGKISYSSLLSLKERLNNIPLNSSDYKLKQIIEDIEVRAAVELEKFKKLSEQTKLFSS